MSTRGPRGRFLALEPAQAGFKQLEIAVTNVFVAMVSGSLRPTNVRYWPKADITTAMQNVRGKADMFFCGAHVCF
jgi:hypothetical protein